MSLVEPLKLEMKYAVIFEEDDKELVVWISEETADMMAGYGRNVYDVKVQRDPLSSRNDVYIIECPCWYDAGGKCVFAVNRCSVEQAILAFDKAVSFLGDVL